MNKRYFHCLLAGSALLLTGCAAPSNGVEELSLPALVFATADSHYRLAGECTRQAKATNDEAGRAFVDVSLHLRAECSAEAAAAVFSRVGEQLTVTYIDAADSPHVLTRDTLIASPIDPANALRISVEDEAQAREIAAGLSQR